MLKGLTEAGTEEGFHQIQEVRFEDGDKQRVSVCFRRRGDLYSFGTTSYRRTETGAWQVVGQREGVPDIGRDGLEVKVNEGLNDPPTVVAKYRQTSRVIWDPNPQIRDLELGSATVYMWKDKEGRHWRGGLFKPRHREPGQRYPLVIQTHGFTESKFIPSGTFPTTFAARALAAEGIVVLQVADLENCLTVTVHEVPCAVSGYEAAVKKLVSEGLVNPDRVGIVGFSRSCFYVMDTLTLSSLRIKAASITDGVMGDYFQYIAAEDSFGNSVAREFDSMIGAKPFGEGLQDWLKRSPGFNLDKVKAPVLINAEGPRDLLSMWEPYAALRYLKRPVDLIILNTDEHVLSNPAVRIASQGGSVDWFRFWLQDYEDPDPAKTDQYARWRQLRTMQEENDRTN
jgi:dipeptidyl aminopeptidase/acylaminoacyl peptidase